MSGLRRIDCGTPALLEFGGPDAVRFLNGQLTQDVRAVAGGKLSLPSCVTDAKGRLQFRVWLTETDGGNLWVEGLPGTAEALEARLTRYLIADDVEVTDRSGDWSLMHFIGGPPEAPAGVIARVANRFGVPGADWWIPIGHEAGFPANALLMEGDELEALRISNGVPLWGRELTEGLLPPEAKLDMTDISYQKGCYIGQEVISRIKSAGKVNKRLVRIVFDEKAGGDLQDLVDSEGNPVGRLTSVSPMPRDGVRDALGYVKRGADKVFVRSAGGGLFPVELI